MAMVYDQRCDDGLALEREEQLMRAEAQIADARRAEARYIGESIGYHCATEGCASDPAYPEHACPNCRAVHGFLVSIGLAPHPADDPIGPEPQAEPAWWNNEWHVDGRFYSSTADAAIARTIRDEKRARREARVQRFLAQRFEITEAGRAALATTEAEVDANAALGRVA
jgi:hypothetical protein